MNWSDQKDSSLGLPSRQFLTREEDEFLMHPSADSSSSAGVATVRPGSTANVSSGVSSGVLTHAVLPPQQYRVGMSAEESAEAKAKEQQARANLDKKTQQKQTEEKRNEMEEEETNAAEETTEQTTNSTASDDSSAQQQTTSMEMSD